MNPLIIAVITFALREVRQNAIILPEAMADLEAAKQRLSLFRARLGALMLLVFQTRGGWRLPLSFVHFLVNDVWNKAAEFHATRLDEAFLQARLERLVLGFEQLSRTDRRIRVIEIRDVGRAINDRRELREERREELKASIEFLRAVLFNIRTNENYLAVFSEAGGRPLRLDVLRRLRRLSWTRMPSLH